MRPPLEETPHVTGTVVGGSSSVSAQLDDLRNTHDFLVGAATMLDGAVRSIGGIDLHLTPQDATLSPATAHACQEQVTVLKQELADASSRATTYAGRMAATAAAYELAEQNATKNFSFDGLFSGVAMTATAWRTGNMTPLETDGATAAIPGVVDALDDILPGSYEDTMATLDRLYGMVDAPSTPVETTLAAGPGDAAAPTAARSIGGSMRQVEAMYADNDEVSHIQVQHVVDPHTGAGRWVVMLPGTSQWTPGHHSVLNGRDNLFAAAGLQAPSETAVRAALEDAMRREGVFDRHEPVMLVGHSQGGITMTSLARHTSPFNITDIVTYGSPVGRMTIPKNVRALNIENSRDMVHKLDGRATGDGDPRRTRLVIDDPDSFDDGTGKKNLIAAHDPGRYRRDYENVAAQERKKGHSAVTDFENSTASFFTGTARTYQYDAQRAPAFQRPHEDPPNPALRPPAMVNPSNGSYVVTSPR